MPSAMGYYNVEEITQKRLQGSARRISPEANLVAAANHVRNLFEGKKLTYGFMGGFEMLCIGHRREIPDLQIAYDNKDFNRIKAKLEGDRRVRLPEGMNSLFPAKCLVRTGPDYKDEACTHNANIEVDLIPPGCYGAPPTGTLASNTVLLSLKSGRKLKTFKGLNMHYLVKTLLHSCRVRDLSWDPLKDIAFLCQQYPEEVQSTQRQLDKKTVRQSLLDSHSFSRLSSDDQRRCYQILLGTEPPPAMSITPAPPFVSHERSTSAPEIPRTSLPLVSDPSRLKPQTTSTLLSPPSPGKLKEARTRVSDSATRVAESPMSQSNIRTEPDTKSYIMPRDSQGRCRSVSASQTASPQSYRLSQPARLSADNSLQSPYMTVQQSFYYRSQPPPNPYSTPMFPQDRNRQPAWNQEASVPLSSASTPNAPILNEGHQSRQQMKQHVFAVEMSASPISLSPRQQYLLSQPDSVRDHPLRQRQIRDERSIRHPLNVNAEHSRTPPFTNIQSPETRSMLATQPKRYRVVNPNPPADHSSHEMSPPGTSSSQPGEHYTALPLSPQNSGDPTAKTSPPPLELDSVSQLGHFIAELSVERSTPAPEQNDKGQLHHPTLLPSEDHSSLLYDNPSIQSSPVSALYDRETLRTSPPTQHQDISIRPLQPCTQSAPIGTLPTSLMAGRTDALQVLQSTIHTPPPPMQAVPADMNVSRYMRYYVATPPSSTSNSPQQTSYKAYQPPLSTSPVPLSAPPSIPLPSQMIPLSPPPMPDSPPISFSSPRLPRRTSFVALKDVDGAGGYFKHRRDKSNDSSASHDSSRLAMEYQATMPSFGEGYGSSRGWEH